MVVLTIILLFIIGGLIWYIKKRNDHEAALIARKIRSSIDLKRTMAMGLAYRFTFPKTKNEDEESVFERATDIFLRQTPLEFEDFVADIMRKKFGGYVHTTTKTGDFGVDFENGREDGLYLGQVKVWKQDVDYVPIALVHSNMVKQGAKGGYVITTSNFTSAAQDYANDLNIVLVNGIQLVNYWLETMDSKVYEPNGEFAS